MITTSIPAAIQDSLAPFGRSPIEATKRVAFLNRYDTKFVFGVGRIPDFLENIRNDYTILQINDIIAQAYESVYFDTPDLLCFNMHHNKRANRFKFRTRQYLSNGKIFNEIKQKKNTGKTVKFRQRRDEAALSDSDIPPLKNLADFDDSFKTLLHNNGYNSDNLTKSLSVFFNRVTFLNKHFAERMTLDFGLRYEYNGLHWSLYDTAVVELKREKGPERTVSQNYFRSIYKEPSGFSKYCIGISLAHDNAKKNRFLPKIKKLPFERSAA